IGASHYRTACSREVVARSIRRSAPAASIGVWYRAGPPFEAAPFWLRRYDPANSRKSAEIAARIVGMSGAPLFHQRLELGVVPVRQHNPGGDEQVAGRPRLRQALAFEAENPPAGGVLRNRQLDRVAQGRNTDLAAQNGLIQRNRQVDAQIVAVDLEEGVRRDADRDQEIAGRMAGRGLALPLQADLLTGNDSGRNLDVEFLAGRQSNALFSTVDRLLQRHRHGDVEVEIERDAARVEFEMRAAARPRAASGAAEHAVEDVFETPAAARAGAASAEGPRLETTARAARTRVAAARKALKPWLAVGIDLAAIELLALVLVADDLVGRVQLGKPLRSLRIVLVAVRVVLLGELAIGALDRRSVGAPRHPQDLIGVAHRHVSFRGNHLNFGFSARLAFIWGLRGIFATGAAGSTLR